MYETEARRLLTAAGLAPDPDELEDPDPAARRAAWLNEALHIEALQPDGYTTESTEATAAASLLICATRYRDALAAGDAAAALERLAGLLVDFPFAAPVDRSVALTALLTGLVRRSLPTAPLIGYSAPIMASGKSLLADLVALLATGRPCFWPGSSPETPAKGGKSAGF